MYLLQTLRELKSLHINLHEEEQVDFIIRSLPDLDFLNGLRVEREEIDDDEEEEDEDRTVPNEDDQNEDE